MTSYAKLYFDPATQTLQPQPKEGVQYVERGQGMFYPQDYAPPAPLTESQPIVEPDLSSIDSSLSAIDEVAPPTSAPKPIAPPEPSDLPELDALDADLAAMDQPEAQSAAAPSEPADEVDAALADVDKQIAADLGEPEAPAADFALSIPEPPAAPPISPAPMRGTTTGPEAPFAVTNVEGAPQPTAPAFSSDFLARASGSFGQAVYWNPDKLNGAGFDYAPIQGQDYIEYKAGVFYPKPPAPPPPELVTPEKPAINISDIPLAGNETVGTIYYKPTGGSGVNVMQGTRYQFLVMLRDPQWASVSFESSTEPVLNQLIAKARPDWKPAQINDYIGKLLPEEKEAILTGSLQDLPKPGFGQVSWAQLSPRQQEQLRNHQVLTWEQEGDVFNTSVASIFGLPDDVKRTWGLDKPDVLAQTEAELRRMQQTGQIKPGQTIDQTDITKITISQPASVGDAKAAFDAAQKLYVDSGGKEGLPPDAVFLGRNADGSVKYSIPLTDARAKAQFDQMQLSGAIPADAVYDGFDADAGTLKYHLPTPTMTTAEIVQAAYDAFDARRKTDPALKDAIVTTIDDDGTVHYTILNREAATAAVQQGWTPQQIAFAEANGINLETGGVTPVSLQEQMAVAAANERAAKQDMEFAVQQRQGGFQVETDEQLGLNLVQTGGFGSDGPEFVTQRDLNAAYAVSQKFGDTLLRDGPTAVNEVLGPKGVGYLDRMKYLGLAPDKAILKGYDAQGNPIISWTPTLEEVQKDGVKFEQPVAVGPNGEEIQMYNWRGGRYLVNTFVKGGKIEEISPSMVTAQDIAAPVAMVVASMAPVGGTAKYWNDMSTPWKVVSVAGDAIAILAPGVPSALRLAKVNIFGEGKVLASEAINDLGRVGVPLQEVKGEVEQFAKSEAAYGKTVSDVLDMKAALAKGAVRAELVPVYEAEIARATKLADAQRAQVAIDRDLLLQAAQKHLPNTKEAKQVMETFRVNAIKDVDAAVLNAYGVREIKSAVPTVAIDAPRVTGGTSLLAPDQIIRARVEELARPETQQSFRRLVGRLPEGVITGESRIIPTANIPPTYERTVGTEAAVGAHQKRLPGAVETPVEAPKGKPQTIADILGKQEPREPLAPKEPTYPRTPLNMPREQAGLEGLLVKAAPEVAAPKPRIAVAEAEPIKAGDWVYNTRTGQGGQVIRATEDELVIDLGGNRSVRMPKTEAALDPTMQRETARRFSFKGLSIIEAENIRAAVRRAMPESVDWTNTDIEAWINSQTDLQAALNPQPTGGVTPEVTAKQGVVTVAQPIVGATPGVTVGTVPTVGVQPISVVKPIERPIEGVSPTPIKIKVPVPTPEPTPKPQPQPKPQPTPTPKPPPPPRVPKQEPDKGKRVRLPHRAPPPDNRARVAIYRNRGVTWKQGHIWVAIYPPFDRGSIHYSENKAANAVVVASARDAWKQVKRLAGGIAPDTYSEWADWF